jgi:3-oxoacyl-[acyl-carrier protein] reductase
VKEITANGGKAIAVHADVSKVEDVKQLFKEANNASGRLDILVNNAGDHPF